MKNNNNNNNNTSTETIFYGKQVPESKLDFMFRSAYKLLGKSNFAIMLYVTVFLISGYYF